jgi:hypothetical protein
MYYTYNYTKYVSFQTVEAWWSDPVVDLFFAGSHRRVNTIPKKETYSTFGTVDSTVIMSQVFKKRNVSTLVCLCHTTCCRNNVCNILLQSAENCGS